MKRILFLFLDGVGLGPNTSSNPFARHDRNVFRQLAAGQAWVQSFDERSAPTHLVRSLDATLGVDGLPQSGTGQATLMTGVNCAQRVGRHFGPFPHSKTYEPLDNANLFHKVQALPLPHKAPAAFANAFPPQYFAATRRRSTVTTRCCRAASVEIRDLTALRKDRALAADLTGATWREILHVKAPSRTPAEAGSVLAATAREHAFTLFEYFLTDKAGHGRIETTPQTLLSQLSDFLENLTTSLDPTQETLLITSDHGNLEDTSHTQHTRNPVPLIVYGWAAPHFAQARDLTDVTPGILGALRAANGSGQHSESADDPYSGPDDVA